MFIPFSNKITLEKEKKTEADSQLRSREQYSFERFYKHVTVSAGMI